MNKSQKLLSPELFWSLVVVIGFGLALFASSADGDHLVGADPKPISAGRLKELVVGLQPEQPAVVAEASVTEAATVAVAAIEPAPLNEDQDQQPSVPTLVVTESAPVSQPANIAPKVVFGQSPAAVRDIYNWSSVVDSGPSRETIAKRSPPPVQSPVAKAPSQTPAPVAVKGNHCYLAYKYSDWPANIAYAICMGESNGRPQAINWADKHKGRNYNCVGSFGLFQIACFHYDPDKLLDPEYNVAKANEIYHQEWQLYGLERL